MAENQFEKTKPISNGATNDWPDEAKKAKFGRNTSFSYAFD